MSFKAFLVSEVLDKPYKYTRASDWYYYFKTDSGDTVSLTFNYDLEDAPTYYERVTIEFERSGSQDITGEGDAFKILATIKKIIIDNLETLRDVDIIDFSAKASEKSRLKLYDRFAKELKKMTKKKYLDKFKLGENYYYVLTDIKDY